MNSSLVTSVEPEAWYAYFIAIYVILSLVSICGNVLVMAAYWITPHLQTPQNLLIFNLSFIDSLVAFLCLPWMIFNYTETGLRYITRKKWDCLFWIMQSSASITASMVAIFALSLERFIAILFPYHFYAVITDRSVRIINTVAWGFSFTVASPPLFDWTIWTPGRRCYIMYVYHASFNRFLTIIRAFILVGTAVMNFCIAVVAVKKSKVDPGIGQVSEEEQGPQQINLKLTKMLLTVVGVFFACWVPFLVLSGIYTTKKGNVSDVFEMILDFAKLLIGLNSTLNPLIYAIGNTKYRATFKKILRRPCGV